MIVDKESLLECHDGFSSREEAEEHLDELIEKFSNFEDVLNLKRVIFIESYNQLNFLDLGSHWIEEDEDFDDHFVEYLQNECSGEEIPGKAYVIEASFNLSDIEIETSLAQNLLNPDEMEIFVKKMAVPVGTATIQPLYELGEAIPLHKIKAQLLGSSELSL